MSSSYPKVLWIPLYINVCCENTPSINIKWILTVTAIIMKIIPPENKVCYFRNPPILSQTKNVTVWRLVLFSGLCSISKTKKQDTRYTISYFPIPIPLQPNGKTFYILNIAQKTKTSEMVKFMRHSWYRCTDCLYRESSHFYPFFNTNLGFESFANF